MRLIDADKLNPDIKTFLSAYSEELIKCYSQKAIDNASTVDAAPVKHGHWRRSKSNERLTAHGFVNDSLYTCSECGWSCNCEENLGFKYCPSCGAKMDGKDGEQE